MILNQHKLIYNRPVCVDRPIQYKSLDVSTQPFIPPGSVNE